jgi:chloramphenicol-sensitive protein RarD
MTEHRTGLWLGISAYLLWGLLPLYLKLLVGVPAPEVLGHRILWSLVLLVAIVLLWRRGPGIWQAARGRTLALLCLSAGLVFVNWFVLIWAVLNGHVLEAALGYFINPLVNVALGLVVLGERVSRVQKIAVGIAAAGVLLLALSGGGEIWISLTLAVSFGLYGLVRKIVDIDALGGLTVETLLLTPIAVALLMLAGEGGVWGASSYTDMLLVLAGPATAIPLLLFSAAARRMPYATLGLLQYIAPTMSFLEAVLIFGEPLRPAHVATFALIWSGCGLYAWDSVRSARRERVAVA